MQTLAKIAFVCRETPTVKSFKLNLSNRRFNFLAGQWIDCSKKLNGDLEVAGYSITSSPLIKGTIELAVKRVGDNAVTQFLHDRARVGDILYVDGGQGNFYYERQMGNSLVLVGGGIGITPLMSIIRYVGEAKTGVRATLLYSATTPSELLFRQELTEIAERNKKIRCLFTVTQSSNESWDGQIGRIDDRMLAADYIDLQALFYVCGPPPMIMDVVGMLDDLGVPSSRIIYEGWQ